MHYIMLIQYELRYDDTYSVAYYYSITTISSFMDYGCEIILISYTQNKQLKDKVLKN